MSSISYKSTITSPVDKSLIVSLGLCVLGIIDIESTVNKDPFQSNKIVSLVELAVNVAVIFPVGEL